VSLDDQILVKSFVFNSFMSTRHTRQYRNNKTDDDSLGFDTSNKKTNVHSRQLHAMINSRE